MSEFEYPEPWEQLEAIVQDGDATRLEQFLDDLPAGEPARAMSRLSEDDQVGVLELLPDAEAADLLSEIPEEQAAQLIEQLPHPQAASIVDDIASHDRAGILSRLDEASIADILQYMEPAEADNTRSLFLYDRETAGGLMLTEFLAYPEDASVDEVCRDIRDHVDTYADYDVSYVYVTSIEGELRGVLQMRDLLFARKNTPVKAITHTDVVSAPTAMPLDDLRLLFERRGLLAIPIVDDGGRLLGIVRQHDIEEETSRQANRAFLRFSGITGGEELRSMPLLLRAGRRLSWLSVNILLNIAAASVIAWHQDTLSAVIALAVFLPIISDMSGCSGNQAVAVSIRELVMGFIKPYEYLRVLMKEASLGLINGIVLGIVLAAITLLWKQNLALAMVVGVALAANTVLAVCLGGSIPLLLRRLGHDPALASGPILTTLTDMCGFWLVLGLASLVLPWLITG